MKDPNVLYKTFYFYDPSKDTYIIRFGSEDDNLKICDNNTSGLDLESNEHKVYTKNNRLIEIHLVKPKQYIKKLGNPKTEIIYNKENNSLDAIMNFNKNDNEPDRSAFPLNDKVLMVFNKAGELRYLYLADINNLYPLRSFFSSKSN